MKKLLPLFLALLSSPLFAQRWVDTTFSIQTTFDISYGTAVDFAGAPRNLKFDISLPVNDTAPACGRPLLVMVHGGAWYAGDKNEGYPKRIREDFAKRGYAAASVQYRLGQFLTDQLRHCNVDGWDCNNMTDTSEWYRANYRGIQDVHGAIRFLINNAATYNIDPNNVFLAGESAGGFVAMGVGFLDDSTEVLQRWVGAYPNAPKPNAHYETKCVQLHNLAAHIDSMNLARPVLGSYQGTLNLPLQQPYSVKAVGNFYGGAFNNIFQSFSAQSPALYLFHQPCDLIVPFDNDKLLQGFNDCAKVVGYAEIENRPFVYGSKGIKTLIDNLKANSLPAPDYLYDVNSNNLLCIQQLPPNPNCHSIDAYWLRTSNMATFFASKMDSCEVIGMKEFNRENLVKSIYPNPAENWVQIDFQTTLKDVKVSVSNMAGILYSNQSFLIGNSVRLNLENLADGIYFIQIETEDGMAVRKLVVK